MKCNEDYGCGRETSSLFSVIVSDPASDEADGEGLVYIKVCRDCAATGDWEEV